MLDNATLIQLQRWAKKYLVRLKRLNLNIEESERLAAEALATIGMGRGFFPADSIKILPEFSGMKMELQVYGEPLEWCVLNIT